MACIIHERGIVPYPGIDTDSMWGFSLTKEWIFGYKLHIICNTDPSSIIVPLVADITTTNMQDNHVYPDLTSSSSSDRSSEIVKKVHFMVVADPGYDDHDLYQSSLKMGF
ncbi:MAG: transposase [Candidatus Nitrosocosmicus sp.]